MKEKESRYAFNVELRKKIPRRNRNCIIKYYSSHTYMSVMETWIALCIHQDLLLSEDTMAHAPKGFSHLKFIKTEANNALQTTWTDPTEKVENKYILDSTVRMGLF